MPTGQTDDTGWLGLGGKRVAVTGAGSGIGHATARAFAGAGAEVFLLDIDDEAAEAAARGIRDEFGVPASGLRVDVGDQDSVAGAFGRIATAARGLDVLANVAGVMRGGPLEELALADWNTTLRVDLDGVLLPSRAAKRLMASGGALVHVASVAASEPVPSGGAYSPAKAAVAMLSRQMSLEWGPDGIRSNCVSPGYVRTPMTESIYADPARLRQREEAIPLRALGTTDEIAQAILFLASPRSSYITGHDLVVDGGLTSTVMTR
jgi:glucose 1-dehydrogenase